jgi:DNA-binding transcriptional MerR regulator
MADYYTIQQLAQKLGVAEASITELEGKGILQAAVKDGRRFYSSRQAYQLRAALRLARKAKIGLEEAFARVESHRLAQISAPGN